MWLIEETARAGGDFYGKLDTTKCGEDDIAYENRNSDFDLRNPSVLRSPGQGRS